MGVCCSWRTSSLTLSPCWGGPAGAVRTIVPAVSGTTLAEFLDAHLTPRVVEKDYLERWVS